MQFIFDNHRLDTERRELHRGLERVAVEPQVFDLLIYLLQNRDRIVSKDDLFASVWGGRVVSESTLTSRINAARKALGDSGPIGQRHRRARRLVDFIRSCRAMSRPGDV